MLAAWGFLEWFFIVLLVGLVGAAGLFGIYVISTMFRNTGVGRRS
ncbi:MAG: hypothetical protein WD004_06265 [Actinomycetota bacterium]